VPATTESTGLATGRPSAPNVPQRPFASGAEARSRSPVPVSRPERASVPFVVATAIEAEVNHGPPTSAAVWPVGAPVSGVTVKLAVLEVPTLLFAVTVWSPAAVVVLD